MQSFGKMNIKMKKALLSFLFLSILSYAQQPVIYDSYPNDQTSYAGGQMQFYKDFHHILMKQNLQPCDDKNGYYTLKLVVYPNATVSYIKDDNDLQASAECGKELTRKVLPHMKGWIPLTVNGEKVAALTTFMIYPNALFENFKGGYNPAKQETMPVFKGGLNGFRQEIADRIDISRFRGKGTYRFNVKFVVNQQGKIENVYIENPSDLQELNHMIIAAVESIKTPWKPATFRNHPVNYYFTLPLSFTFP